MHGVHELYYPDAALKKITKYKFLVMQKSLLTEADLDLLLCLLLRRVELVKSVVYKDKIKAAMNVMSGIDPEDTPFLALALSIPDCAIWSNDKHLKKQKLVDVYTTSDILIP